MNCFLLRPYFTDPGLGATADYWVTDSRHDEIGDGPNTVDHGGNDLHYIFRSGHILYFHFKLKYSMYFQQGILNTLMNKYGISKYYLKYFLKSAFSHVGYFKYFSQSILIIADINGRRGWYRLLCIFLTQTELQKEINVWRSCSDGNSVNSFRLTQRTVFVNIEQAPKCNNAPIERRLTTANAGRQVQRITHARTCPWG